MLLLDCSSLESIFIPSSVTVFNGYDDNADTLTELKLSENETDMDFSELTDKRISFTVSLYEVADGSGIYFQPGDVGIYEWFDLELLDNNPEYSNLSS